MALDLHDIHVGDKLTNNAYPEPAEVLLLDRRRWVIVAFPGRVPFVVTSAEVGWSKQVPPTIDPAAVFAIDMYAGRQALYDRADLDHLAGVTYVRITGYEVVE